MKIVLATRNPSKAVQIRAIFAGSPFEIITLDDINIKGDAEENGATLEENALKKAMFVHEKTKDWAMADDSGIFIDALSGEPGIKSARWAGDDASTEEITNFTLEKLEGCKNRTATFKTAVALVTPEGKFHIFEGEVPGRVLETPRTKPQPKMPYSPIFVPDGEKLCWAEMTTEYENKISHRGKAFRKVREFLEKLG
jgi:XTP/dITP diphosphohydrolase